MKLPYTIDKNIKTFFFFTFYDALKSSQINNNAQFEQRLCKYITSWEE